MAGYVRPSGAVVFCRYTDCYWQRSGGWCDCSHKKVFDISRGSSCPFFELLIDPDDVSEYEDYHCN